MNYLKERFGFSLAKGGAWILNFEADSLARYRRKCKHQRQIDTGEKVLVVETNERLCQTVETAIVRSYGGTL